MKQHQILTGHAVAPGIAIGPALVYRSHKRAQRRQQSDYVYEPLYLRAATRELERLRTAVASVEAALATVEAQLKSENQLEESQIFGTYRMLLMAPALNDRTIALIVEAGWLAEDAMMQAGSEWATTLEQTSEPEQRLLASDVRAVAGQVWRMLITDTSLSERLKLQPAIIIADDIGPSELMSLPRENLLGLVLAHGGQTAHAAILVRAWNIPAVIGLGDDLLQQVGDGTPLALDGSRGTVAIEPSTEVIVQMRTAADTHARTQHDRRTRQGQHSATRDGQTIRLLANVSSLAGAQAAREWGAAGIGSLRTELLFLGYTELPSEDEQVELYLSVAAELPGLSIVARTLDMGGDKQLPIFPLPCEDNPFLGWRGIRIGLSRQHDLLLPQLRAMLRAGASADIRIVAPMIATLHEWRQVRALVQQAHSELIAAGVPCVERPHLGILIEVPGAALIADHLAREADFLSIGSNDLIQYTLACDRTNPRVSHLYQPLEPAILQMIATITEAAHRYGRTVSLCGEMASEPEYTPLLIGLGIDELSCTPPALPDVRAAVCATNSSEARELACAALAAATRDDVRALP